MNNYAISFTERNGDGIFSKPIETKEELDSLRKELMEDDNKNITRFHYIFPNTTKGTQIQNSVLKIIATISAFFLDLITMPFYYSSRRQNLINNMAIYKFLKKENVPEKNIKVSNILINFHTLKDEKTVETEGNYIRIYPVFSDKLIYFGSIGSTSTCDDAKTKVLFEKSQGSSVSTAD